MSFSSEINVRSTNALVGDYERLFPDWNQVVKEDTQIALMLGQTAADRDVQTVIDVTAGIGTQALGLARYGLRVVAADIWYNALFRLRERSNDQRLNIDTVIHDVKAIPFGSSIADLAVSMGSSLVLLDSYHAVEAALSEMRRIVGLGGGVVIGVRDHKALKLSSIIGRSRRLRTVCDRLVTEVWEEVRQVNSSWNLHMEIVEQIDAKISQKSYCFHLLTIPCKVFLEMASAIGLRLIRTEITPTGFRYDGFRVVG